MGKYLHFSLYKENKDTMEAIGHISRILNVKPAFFGTAGTKDRRAVTTQRVSIRGRDPTRLVFLNDRIPGVKIGDFKFEQRDVFLGCHRGNEFDIVLKDCTFRGTENETFERQLEIAQSTIDSALETIIRHGFINYFGTQRFGTYEIGTHVIGTKILKGDFAGAVQDLLSFDPALTNFDTSTYQPGDFVRNDDIARAKSLQRFQETGDAQEACKTLPRRCNTEFNILRHLGKQPNDYVGALLSLPRNMRNMYLHAYQSLIWNFVVSRRWKLHGAQVVKGDLVLLKTPKAPAAEAPVDADEIDEETIGLSRGPDVKQDNTHALTAEEAESGRFSILDVVLPTPGCDVVYPDNEVGQYYAELMAKEENGELDPNDMQRRQRDFTLAGTYRKVMGSFIGTPTGSVRSYTHDHDQLIPTDVDLIRSRKMEEAAARRAVQEEKNHNWQRFAGDVEETERKAARTAFERRQAEGDTEFAIPRMSDTWVETSLDGSNKRAKVGSHTTEIDHSGTPPDADSAGDAIIVDKHEADIDGAAVQRQTKVGQQVDSEQGAQKDYVTGTTSALDPDEPTIPKTERPHRAAGEQAVISSDTTVQVSSSVTPATPKIAVILKFALESSQYATMVLRELQG
jgi:tRNA pseudouridine13 synthase